MHTTNIVARNALGVATNGVSASGFSSYLKTQIESLRNTITMAKNDEAATARGEILRLKEGDMKDGETAKDYSYINSKHSDFQALCNGLLADLKAFKA